MNPTLLDPRSLRFPILATVMLAGIAGAQSPDLGSVSSRVADKVPVVLGDLPSTAPSERHIGPAPARRQEPDDALVTTKPMRVDHERMYYDEPGDGNVWARGTDYKASFGVDGVFYYPRLGPNAPRNVPHALSPEVVTIGGEPIPFARAATATRAGDRVELDRGAFVEAYDFTPASIEQTFVFQTLPRAGDIVVHIPIASEFEGRSTEQGLEFRGEHATITYSRAIVVDAAGKRAVARTELESGSIVIHVDEEFLASAAMPLVIDPVITTLSINGGVGDGIAADVAWDTTNFCWLAVYQIPYTATDHDVLGYILNHNGTVRNAAYLDLTTADWRAPRCANLNAYDQCLVVATNYTMTTPAVVGREVQMLNMSQNPQITIQVGGQRPVVGGDPFEVAGAAAYYCVVWEADLGNRSAIFARLVTPNNTLLGSSAITIVDEPFGFDNSPAISKSNGGSDWMIAWDYYDNANNQSNILGSRVSWNGAVTVPFYTIQPSLAYDPRVSVSSSVPGTLNYLLAYQRRNLGQSNNEIALILLNGTTIASTLNLSLAENTGSSRNCIDPSVDANGDHFLVAYSESASGGDYDVSLSEVGISGGALALVQGHQVLGSSPSNDARPRLAGLSPAGETNSQVVRDFVLAWDVDAGTGFGEMLGAVYRGNVGGGKTPFCFGDGSGATCPCGNTSAPGSQAGCLNSFGTGGRLIATGDASTTSDSLVLTATGLTPNGAPPIFLQGTAQVLSGVGAWFGDGLRCAAGSVIRLGTSLSVAGISSFGYGIPGTQSVSIRGAILAPGATRYYQVNYRNAPVFCTSATFNLTNGVAISWMP